MLEWRFSFLSWVMFHLHIIITQVFWSNAAFSQGTLASFVEQDAWRSLHRHWVFKIPSLRSRYPKSEVNSGSAFPSWFFFFHCGFIEVLYNRFWKKLCFHVPSVVWQPRVTNRGTEVSAYRGCCLIFHNRNTFHLICSCERLMLLHSLLKCFEQKALRDICVWLSKCY